jgi:hypothetical protein
MPEANQFRHQPYPSKPSAPVVFRSLDSGIPDDRTFPELHTTLKVGRVILVHGTFMGDDPFGVVETLKSFAKEVPALAAVLSGAADSVARHTRPFLAHLARDLGNYTPAFRDRFQNLVGDDPRVELMDPTWSSENHHLARADLAVRLLDQLLQRPLIAGQKTLLWGHSHAGNGFAILSNLLANDRKSVQKFFSAIGPIEGGHWSRVQRALSASATPHPLAKSVLVATFGTPVRYGWDTTGLDGLVHLNFHRIFDQQNPERARPLFPLYSISEVLGATWGDWVQTFAIAGTDVPSIPGARAIQQLELLLEGSLEAPVHDWDTRLIASQRVRDACARWKHGTRCHADGVNLLVDYKESGETLFLGMPIEAAAMGHGVATSVHWLPAHLDAIVTAFQGRETPLTPLRPDGR